MSSSNNVGPMSTMDNGLKHLFVLTICPVVKFKMRHDEVDLSED
jgi:hypothetical protein